MVWISKKQHVVARSSVEAEHHAIANATCEVLSLTSLLEELSVPLSTTPTIWTDNNSVVALFENLVQHSKMKNVEIDMCFIREKVVAG